MAILWYLKKFLWDPGSLLVLIGAIFIPLIFRNYSKLMKLRYEIALNEIEWRNQYSEFEIELRSKRNIESLESEFGPGTSSKPVGGASYIRWGRLDCENKEPKVEPKIVDCEWGKWSLWDACSKSCGSGVTKRSRDVAISPKCGGKFCIGRKVEERYCNTRCCRQNCKWDRWSKWSSCSSVCGPGIKTRFRKVAKMAACGGVICQGETKQSKGCDVKKCSVSCNENPIHYFEQLPHYCNHADGTPKYIDVGKCPEKPCSNKIVDFGKPENCCGPSVTEAIEESCNDVNITINKITKCGCQECEQKHVVVNLNVIGGNSNDPLKTITIKRGSEVIGRTDEDGSFSFNVLSSIRQITITCITKRKQFLSITKILTVPKGIHEIHRTIKMNRRPPTIRVRSLEESTILLKPPPGPDEEEGSVDIKGEVTIPPKSIFNIDGTIYTNEVHASMFALDNEDEIFEDFSPGAFRMKPEGKDEDMNPPKPLKNYGVMEMSFTDGDGNDLHVNNLEISLDASHITFQDDLENMHIWSFDEESGFWEDEGETEVFKVKDEENSHVFLKATISITSRRLWSLNVVIDKYCLAKVRTYASDKLDYRGQLSGVPIRTLYLDPDGKSHGYSKEYTESGQGACIMVPCDDKSYAIQDMLFTANEGEKDQYSASFKFYNKTEENTTAYGISSFTASLLHYRTTQLPNNSFAVTFSQNISLLLSNQGPVYDSTNMTACILAPFWDQHFAFYRSVMVAPNLVEKFDTVPSSPFEYNLLNWFPNPPGDLNKVCYIKVLLESQSSVIFQSTSSGGTRNDLKGKLFGFRQVMTEGNSSFVCLEFKCYARLYDGMEERPLVSLKAAYNQCNLKNINELLELYLLSVSPHVPINLGDEEFRFYAPKSSLGARGGVFIQSGFNKTLTENNTRNKCQESSSPPAVMFEC